MSKVWKKVVVVKTVELEVGIDEELLTSEFLDYYSKSFSEVDSPDDIFDTVGFQYVNCSERFAEGVGKVGGRFDREDDFPVIVKIDWEDVEVEVEDVE